MRFFLLEHCTGCGVAGATGGAAVGSVVPVVGTASGAMTGFKGGYVAGVGVHSYEQVRGAAYRTMIEHGIDHETARAAAMDEALVSALIEAADAGVDVLTLGLNGLLGKMGNAAARKAASLFGKYGINLLSESAEEGLQQSVSYVNLDRVQNGGYDPNANGLKRVWDLIAGFRNTLGDAVTGKDLTAREQILSAMGQGAKLAALFGGPTAVAFDIASNPIQQTSSQVTVKPVQSPTERDIINTEELWTQQRNEIVGSSFKFSELTESETEKIVDSYRHKAPITIPDTAVWKAKSMTDGYEQIQYKWNDETYKYDVRWHTRTSGAPADQGNTWVIQRTIPGHGGVKPTNQFLIGNNEWVEGWKWYSAIAARKNGTATKEQIEILDRGHWKE